MFRLTRHLWAHFTAFDGNVLQQFLYILIDWVEDNTAQAEATELKLLAETEP